MKVIIIVNHYYPEAAGIAAYVRDLRNYLNEKEHKVDILSKKGDGGIIKADWLVNIPLLKYFVRYKIGKLEKYDVVISNFPTVNAVLTGCFISKKQGIPHMVIDHGISPPNRFKTTRAKLAHWIEGKLHVPLLKKADKAIIISNFFNPHTKNSIVVYDGINIKYETKKTSSSILEKYDLKKDNYILYVGRISRHKGIHLLIKAWKKLPEDKKIPLVIVGGLPVEDYLNELKKEGSDKRIIFTGRIPDNDLLKLRQECMFYATGTIWETFDLPIVKSQACGKPVIGFDLCSHPEVVQRNRTGFLVPPKDVEGFSEKMLLLIKDKKLRKRMGENAKKFAKKFDWSIIGPKIERELKKIIDEKKE